MGNFNIMKVRTIPPIIPVKALSRNKTKGKEKIFILVPFSIYQNVSDTTFTSFTVPPVQICFKINICNIKSYITKTG